MPLARGQIVRSKAGRDKGDFLAVVGNENGCVTVCDGKGRPLENPKRKNEKHLAPTKSFLSDEQLLTNKSVRNGLREFSRTVKGDE